jgi:hypothetical protein
MVLAIIVIMTVITIPNIQKLKRTPHRQSTRQSIAQQMAEREGLNIVDVEMFCAKDEVNCGWNNENFYKSDILI